MSGRRWRKRSASPSSVSKGCFRFMREPDAIAHVRTGVQFNHFVSFGDGKNPAGPSVGRVQIGVFAHSLAKLIRLYLAT